MQTTRRLIMLAVFQWLCTRGRENCFFIASFSRALSRAGYPCVVRARCVSFYCCLFLCTVFRWIL